jgi:hypothetical protein
MDKLDAVLLYFAVEHISTSQAFGKNCADLPLKQLDESAPGLEMLPEPELDEIFSSAIRVCGFVDAIEARDVIAIVLDAIEMQAPIREELASEEQGIALCDA